MQQQNNDRYGLDYHAGDKLNKDQHQNHKGFSDKNTSQEVDSSYGDVSVPNLADISREGFKKYSG